MKTIELAKATLPLADYTKDVINEPVIVTAKGKPIAVLISLENIDMETVSLSNNSKFLALIEHSRKNQKLKGGLSTEEIRKRLKLTNA